MPIAIDTSKVVLNQGSRSIDIFSYGRRDETVHQALRSHYNQCPEHHRLYLHSTFSGGNVEDIEEHMLMQSKLLNYSKISLCFEPSNIPRFRGASPLLFRWFEAWLHGCAVVGTKPLEAHTVELMDWENSTITIPKNPSDLIPFFESLLEDQELLRAISARNHTECLMRHDWSYRLRDMFNTLELSVPDVIVNRIRQLQSCASDNIAKLK